MDSPDYLFLKFIKAGTNFEVSICLDEADDEESKKILVIGIFLGQLG